MSEHAMPVPPPTLEFLVLSIKMQAEMQMGLMNFGQQPEQGPDLVGARHAIDMLEMLQAKTRGNLTMEEQRLLENSLTELRFRFVQVSEESAKSPQAAAAEVPSGSDATAEAAVETESKEVAQPAASPAAEKAAAKAEDQARQREDEPASGTVKVTDRRTSSAAKGDSSSEKEKDS